MGNACATGTATTRRGSVKWQSCQCCGLLVAWCSTFCRRGFIVSAITGCMQPATDVHLPPHGLSPRIFGSYRLFVVVACSHYFYANLLAFPCFFCLLS